MTRDEFNKWAASLTDDQIAHIKQPHLAEMSVVEAMVKDKDAHHAARLAAEAEREAFRAQHTDECSLKVKEARQKMSDALKRAEDAEGMLDKVRLGFQRTLDQLVAEKQRLELRIEAMSAHPDVAAARKAKELDDARRRAAEAEVEMAAAQRKRQEALAFIGN